MRVRVGASQEGSLGVAYAEGAKRKPGGPVRSRVWFVIETAICQEEE